MPNSFNLTILAAICTLLTDLDITKSEPVVIRYEILNGLEDESNYYDDSLSESRQSTKMIRSLNQIINTLNIIEECNNSKDSCKERLVKKDECRLYKILIDELAEVSADKLNERLNGLDDKLNHKVVCHKCQKKKVIKSAEECGDIELAEFLYKCRLNTDFKDYMKWIPYDEFGKINYLARGGFGEVYKAEWFDSYIKRGRNVVLKKLYNSSNKILEILQELEAHNLFNNNFVNKCYGITKDPDTTDYLLVLSYAQGGDLHHYLSRHFPIITWEYKIKSLYNISSGLKEIHKNNYVHHDLHSGNIFSYFLNHCLIGDLGLCQQPSEDGNPKEVYGVIAYLAPEVLEGGTYTKESDIYSFGMIMWEFTTGQKPFYNTPHDFNLIVNITEGERPIITNDTPGFYAELMTRCWDMNPKNRPSAEEITKYLEEFVYNSSKEQKEIVQSAEKNREEIINSEKYLLQIKNHKQHPEAFYTSRPISNLIQQAHDLSNLRVRQGATINYNFNSNVSVFAPINN